MALSCVISEIFNVDKCRDLDFLILAYVPLTIALFIVFLN